MSKYWDINRILRYQRNFNFINGERSIGKTYTTQKWLFNKALTTGRQFVYLCRTKTDKFNKAFSEAFEKVLDKEFPDNDIVCDNENMYSGEGDEKGRIGYCLALSEAPDVKKRSFPKVDYIMFDEYMLEREHNFKYVTGWHEPDLLLNIYHTIDRESDRVKVFCLGNTTEFYNPYHTHKAFNIPAVEKGKIWYSDNVLFQWAEKSEELKEEKSK